MRPTARQCTYVVSTVSTGGTEAMRKVLLPGIGENYGYEWYGYERGMTLFRVGRYGRSTFSTMVRDVPFRTTFLLVLGSTPY